MALPGGGEREYMATGHKRLKPLHNFSLPYLKWGNQKHLTCTKVESPGDNGARIGGGEHRVRRRSPPSKLDNPTAEVDDQHWRSMMAAPLRSEGIHEFSENLMSDLRTFADQMKESIFRKETFGRNKEEKETGKEKERRGEKRKQKEDSPPASVVAEEARPWTLRTRRLACNLPIAGAGNHNGNGKGLSIEEKRAKSSPLRKDLTRPKFSLSLTRKETEEDFKKLLGHRPPRRPKKRPRMVQKQLDFLFPGLFLSEVTPSSYKVPEPTNNGKR